MDVGVDDRFFVDSVIDEDDGGLICEVEGEYDVFC